MRCSPRHMSCSWFRRWRRGACRRRRDESAARPRWARPCAQCPRPAAAAPRPARRAYQVKPDSRGHMSETTGAGSDARTTLCRRVAWAGWNQRVRSKACWAGRSAPPAQQCTRWEGVALGRPGRTVPCSPRTDAGRKARRCRSRVSAAGAPDVLDAVKSRALWEQQAAQAGVAASAAGKRCAAVLAARKSAPRSILPATTHGLLSTRARAVDASTSALYHSDVPAVICRRTTTADTLKEASCTGYSTANYACKRAQAPGEDRTGVVTAAQPQLTCTPHLRLCIASVEIWCQFRVLYTGSGVRTFKYISSFCAHTETLVALVPCWSTARQTRRLGSKMT